MCIQYRRIHGVDDLMISSGIMVPGERSLLHLGSAPKDLEKSPLEHAASAVAGSFSLRKKALTNLCNFIQALALRRELSGKPLFLSQHLEKCQWVED